MDQTLFGKQIRLIILSFDKHINKKVWIKFIYLKKIRI